MGVSKNRGTPKSSILIGLPSVNHPFWGTPIFGNTRVNLFFVVSLGVFDEFCEKKVSARFLKFDSLSCLKAIPNFPMSLVEASFG